MVEAIGSVTPLDATKVAADLKAVQDANVALIAERDQLKKAVGDGATKLNELHQTIVSPEYLEFLKGKSSGDQGKKGSDGKKQEDQPDLNSMDNVELANFVISQVKQVVGEIVKPVAAKTDQVDIRAQVKEAADQFKDFWDYQPAMVTLSEKYPSLDPRSIYIMVKGLETSTGKSFKVQKKVVEGEDGAMNDSSRRDERKPASGELGSGPSGDLGGVRKAEAVTYSEAAGRAYDEIFGKK